MIKCPICGDSVADLELHLKKAFNKSSKIYTLIIHSHENHEEIITKMIQAVMSPTIKVEIA